MKVKTPEESESEQTIRKLYSFAEGNSKNTPTFVSLFGGGSLRAAELRAGEAYQFEWSHEVVLLNGDARRE